MINKEIFLVLDSWYMTINGRYVGQTKNAVIAKEWVKDPFSPGQRI